MCEHHDKNFLNRIIRRSVLPSGVQPEAIPIRLTRVGRDDGNATIEDFINGPGKPSAAALEALVSAIIAGFEQLRMLLHRIADQLAPPPSPAQGTEDLVQRLGRTTTW